MTIGRLAAAAGVGVETVRYYQRRGLLAVPARAGGGIGRYGPQALMRLRFIRRAQSLGFSLDDVHALLSLEDGRSCASARRIGEHKLAEVRARLQSLRALESALSGLLRHCAATRGQVRCPLIGALKDDAGYGSGVAQAPPA
jgi:MerR family mercuric resistance operon transcriptional regulator